LLKAHAWLGVGPGGWLAQFPSVMEKDLSGLNPVYLHSDLLQGLIEFGIVGLIVPLFLLAIFVWRGVRALRRARSAERYLVIAVLSGLLGAMVGAGLDFPLRMPAIVFALCAYLALGAHTVQKLEAQDTTAENQES
jgi:O-antigen ligase